MESSIHGFRELGANNGHEVSPRYQFGPIASAQSFEFWLDPSRSNKLTIFWWRLSVALYPTFPHFRRLGPLLG